MMSYTYILVSIGLVDVDLPLARRQHAGHEAPRLGLPMEHGSLGADLHQSCISLPGES